jgi:cell division protein FtsZ
VESAQQAISSPLLEDMSIAGASGVLINITGGPDLSLHEVSEVSSVIHDAAGEDANIIFGAVIDPNLKGEIRVTVIATGIGAEDRRPETREPAASVRRDEPRQKPDPAIVAMTGSTTEEENVDELDDILSAFELQNGNRKDDLEIPAFIRRQMR